MLIKIIRINVSQFVYFNKLRILLDFRAINSKRMKKRR